MLQGAFAILAFLDSAVIEVRCGPQPGVDQAFASVEQIMRDVNYCHAARSGIPFGALFAAPLADRPFPPGFLDEFGAQVDGPVVARQGTD